MLSVSQSHHLVEEGSGCSRGCGQQRFGRDLILFFLTSYVYRSQRHIADSKAALNFRVVQYTGLFVPIETTLVLVHFTNAVWSLTSKPTALTQQDEIELQVE